MQVILSKLITPIDVFFSDNHGEGGSSQVPFRPLFQKELLDMPVEKFLASLRFHHWGKLEQLGIDLGSFD
jgi:hypothetical protein